MRSAGLLQARNARGSGNRAASGPFRGDPSWTLSRPVGLRSVLTRRSRRGRVRRPGRLIPQVGPAGDHGHLEPAEPFPHGPVVVLPCQPRHCSSVTFEAGHHLAVLHLVDGDMAHSPVGGSAVPVLFARFEEDDVAGADLLDGAAFALYTARAEGDEQRLSQRVRVPGGTGAGVEGHIRALHAVGEIGVEQRIDPYRPGEPVARSCSRRLVPAR